MHRTIAAWPIGIASGVLCGADVVSGFLFFVVVAWLRFCVLNRRRRVGNWDIAYTLCNQEVERMIAVGEEHEDKE